MSLRIALDHQTQYRYDRMVFLSTQWIRLKPAAHARTVPQSYVLTISPTNHEIHWQQDPFGNFVLRVDFAGAVSAMTVHVQFTVDLKPVNPFDFFVETYAESFPFRYNAQLEKDLIPYLGATESGPYWNRFINGIDQTKQRTIDFLIMLNQSVYQTIRYEIRLDPGVQTAEQTLARATGSCRDSAWVLVQLLRQAGLAARFVSGYLVQTIGNGLNSAGPTSTQTDSVDLHAWAEVYLPGAGWIGLDATSGMLTTESHIPLACTPYPAGAAPITGTTTQCGSLLTYQSSLTRLTK